MIAYKKKKEERLILIPGRKKIALIFLPIFFPFFFTHEDTYPDRITRKKKIRGDSNRIQNKRGAKELGTTVTHHETTSDRIRSARRFYGLNLKVDTIGGARGITAFLPSSSSSSFFFHLSPSKEGLLEALLNPVGSNQHPCKEVKWKVYPLQRANLRSNLSLPFSSSPPPFIFRRFRNTFRRVR